MSAYTPTYIVGNKTGLVQEREDYLLPNDAYPVLENAFVWRERIKRKQGFELLGRLQRSVDVANALTAGSINLISALSLQSSAQIVPSSINLVGGTDGTTYTDPSGNGTLTATGGTGTGGTINYQSGVLTITSGGGQTMTGTVNYYPNLPVMGLRQKDLNSTNNQLTIAFDTTYAYIFSSGSWREYIPGTTWTGNDSNFFWSTNWGVDASNNRLFWVTNFSGTSGDPIRYTNGVTWTNFAPQIDAVPTYLEQCLCMLPYRGRLLVFNTLEGANLATSVSYPQRIRWSAISSPLASNAWRDDIIGQGGYLDIPTNESIVSVGNVRDNIVIYCRRSTWQLRYTGRSIAPFQIEKINPELGAEGTFSTIQFDASLVGIGDKGIVECDSYKSTRIDVKIPDLVFSFSDNTEGMQSNTGTERIQAVRDFVNRLAFWTYATQEDYPYTVIYPNRRLVYNYENDSWGIFTDSLTALGTFISSGGRTWATTNIPWSECNFPWISRQGSVPDVIGGNQQGFVFYLDSKVSNDPSLTITAITGNSSTNQPTKITSPNHNLTTGQVIQINGITSTGYATLNGGIFGVVANDKDNLSLYLYNTEDDQFTIPQLDASQTYNGGGLIAVRDNFWIQSKKFNFMEQGESIQLGYMELLMPATQSGAISIYLFDNYDESEPVNTIPQNQDPDTGKQNTFFNSVIETSNPQSTTDGASKYWHRVYCPSRGNFMTVVYTLSNSQLIGIEQESEVQIDAQVLWSRPAGRMRNI